MTCNPSLDTSDLQKKKKLYIFLDDVSGKLLKDKNYKEQVQSRKNSLTVNSKSYNTGHDTLANDHERCKSIIFTHRDHKERWREDHPFHNLTLKEHNEYANYLNELLSSLMISHLTAC